MTIVFPELKESEDERIRKELLNYLYDVHDDDEERARWISWLEKQGEHANFLSKIQVGDKVTRNEDGVLVNLSQLKRVAKPADKVEPKFKNGDWVVTSYGKVNQIVSVDKDDDDGYTLDDGTYFSGSWCDMFHLWTIQDAKDGDVLSYRDGQWIFIYKGIVNEDTFKYYALLSEKGITVNDAAFSLLTSCIIPATKEQRDTLMKAMADAGYTFDFEKKELKKIEQKHAWSEEDEIMFRKAIITIDNVRMNTGSQEYYQGICDWLKSLKDRVQPRPEQEWSEKDEIIRNSLLESLTKIAANTRTDSTSLNLTFYNEIQWLKSLKNRYTWKPSDEQMQVLSNAGNSYRPFEEGHKVLWSLYNDLKKLKS